MAAEEKKSSGGAAAGGRKEEQREEKLRRFCHRQRKEEQRCHPTEEKDKEEKYGFRCECGVWKWSNGVHLGFFFVGWDILVFLLF